MDVLIVGVPRLDIEEIFAMLALLRRTALCGCAGVWLLLARVWLCEDPCEDL